jgi:hypothetical protein
MLTTSSSRHHLRRCFTTSSTSCGALLQ